MKKRFTLVVMAAFALGILPCPLQGAKNAIPLEGTKWVLTGKTTGNVSGVGKLKEEKKITLILGPYGNDAPAGEFLVDDWGGTFYTGTFKLKNKTYVLNPGNNSLRDYVKERFLALAAAQGIPAEVHTVDLGPVKITVKPKAIKMGISLMLTVNIKATVDGKLDGQDVKSNLSIIMKHRGEKEIPIEGSTWLNDVKMRVNIKKMAKIKDEGTLTLSLGPQEGFLGDGEFHGLGDEGELVTGTYIADAKGNLSFQLNETEFEAFLALFITLAADPGMPLDNVAVNLISEKTKITAKVKPGESVKFSLKVSFTVEAEVVGQPYATTGTLTMKGSGTPQ
jgi:hypothetical protein